MSSRGDGPSLFSSDEHNRLKPPPMTRTVNKWENHVKLTATLSAICETLVDVDVYSSTGHLMRAFFMSRAWSLAGIRVG